MKTIVTPKTITPDYIIQGIKNMCPLAKGVHFNVLQWNDKITDIAYLTIDALCKEDWPSGIAQNSVYVSFQVQLREGKVLLSQTGHIYPSDADRQKPEWKHYTMLTMGTVHKMYGGVPFRKGKYVTEDMLIIKAASYFNAVMESVVKYTGGYPYTRGI